MHVELRNGGGLPARAQSLGSHQDITFPSVLHTCILSLASHILIRRIIVVYVFLNKEHHLIGVHATEETGEGCLQLETVPSSDIAKYRSHYASARPASHQRNAAPFTMLSTSERSEISANLRNQKSHLCSPNPRSPVYSGPLLQADRRRSSSMS